MLENKKFDQDAQFKNKNFKFNRIKSHNLKKN